MYKLIQVRYYNIIVSKVGYTAYWYFKFFIILLYTRWIYSPYIYIYIFIYPPWLYTFKKSENNFMDSKIITFGTQCIFECDNILRLCSNALISVKTLILLNRHWELKYRYLLYRYWQKDLQNTLGAKFLIPVSIGLFITPQVRFIYFGVF